MCLQSFMAVHLRFDSESRKLQVKRCQKKKRQLLLSALVVGVGQRFDSARKESKR